MIPYRRLLVQFDGSKASWAALRHAEAIARRNHGCLVVAQVLDGAWCACGWPGFSIAVPASEMERMAMRELRAAVDTLSDDVSVVSVVGRGAVGRALARIAVTHQCDAIVLGPRRRLGGLTWPGAAERQLRRHSRLPVLVVGAEHPRAPRRALRERLAFRTPRQDPAIDGLPPARSPRLKGAR